MDFVEGKQDIINNINTLNCYKNKTKNEIKYFKQRIKQGLCFICYNKDGEYIFSPSRFTGYKNNSKFLHEKNNTKDGRKTNPVISKILLHKCESNKNIDKKYVAFCNKHGITPSKKEKKYWELQKQ